MALQNDIRILTSLAAFRDLEADALRLVALSAETRILRAGDVLFRQGETAQGGFIVLGGSIELERNTGAAPAAVVRPPTLIGEAALLTATLRPAKATACEPSSVLEVTRKLYRRVLAEYPDSAQRMRDSAAARLDALRGDFEGFAASLAG